MTAAIRASAYLRASPLLPLERNSGASHACLQLDGASLHFHAMCILRLPQTNSELVATVCFAVAVNGDGVAYVDPSDGDSIAYVVKRRVHFIHPSGLSNDISFT